MTPTDSNELRLEAVISAPTMSVWMAIRDSRHRSAWWSYLDLDASAGGRLLERWRDADGREQQTRGTILEVEPGRLLRCTWQVEAWDTPTELDLALRDEGQITRRVAALRLGAA